MNRNSEQLRYDTSVVEAQDQPLTPSELYAKLENFLGKENLSKQVVCGRKVIVYRKGDKEFVLLAKNVTYLGNPHPIYKKRVQLPDWYQEFCLNINYDKLAYDVRFMGIYHFEGNVIFVDFIKDTYLNHGIHNSSAHVYVNDLYQAMTYGMFRKIDKQGNQIVTIRSDKLDKYLNGTEPQQESLFELFEKFNCGYPFGKWLYALDIIKEMHKGSWQQWRQAEWAGWFLEYKFDEFVRKNKLEHRMNYVGSSNKKNFDFDIRFEEADFYGDLKASDINKKETPGNDQKSLVECIYRYKKFWYVIYEHETIKDAHDEKYLATIDRNRYIKSVDPTYSKDEMSYASRMKRSVKFVRMTIIELNTVNFRNALKTFNQGHQPDGSARAPKFNINKEVLKNDNYVVFRYSYAE